MNFNHKYLNYVYLPYEEIVDDNFKIWHEIENVKTGERMTADFTPYCFMSKIDFKNFVDLGFPHRGGDVSPLSPDKLRKMRNEVKR